MFSFGHDNLRLFSKDIDQKVLTRSNFDIRFNHPHFSAMHHNKAYMKRFQFYIQIHLLCIYLDATQYQSNFMY